MASFLGRILENRCGLRRGMVFGGVMGLALASLPASVAAEDLIETSKIIQGQTASLDLQVKGNVPGHCVLNGGGDYRLGELRGGLKVKLPFGLICNVPFNVSLQSARGGLAHTSMSQGQGPFSGLLEYDLQLTIPTLTPVAAVMEGRFSSRDLLGVKSLSSENGIATEGGTLALVTRNPEGAGLLAGRYTETLTLTVAPQI